jgi:hypothetical protein
MRFGADRHLRGSAWSRIWIQRPQPAGRLPFVKLIEIFGFSAISISIPKFKVELSLIYRNDLATWVEQSGIGEYTPALFNQGDSL